MRLMGPKSKNLSTFNELRNFILFKISYTNYLNYDQVYLIILRFKIDYDCKNMHIISLSALVYSQIVGKIDTYTFLMRGNGEICW